MSDFPILTTVVFFLINGASFMAAIQLPPDLYRRLAYAPILYGGAILSVQASSHDTLLLGMLGGIWGMTLCYGLCHMTNVLYIDPVQASSWTIAYKLWLDPRRQTDPAKPLHRSTSSERISFAAWRILKAICCWAMTVCTLGPIIGKLAFTSDDFAPPRQAFIRRIPVTIRDIQVRYLGSKFGFISDAFFAPQHHFLEQQIPITLRDIQLRLVCVVLSNAATYLTYDTAHIISSVLFVTILRLDTPQEFPPLFGSPFEAYSVRRYWSRFSHRITVSFSASSGKVITRQVLGKKPGLYLQTEKVFLVLWTFVISAACHSAVEWSIGEYTRTKLQGYFYYYLANFFAGALEAFVLPSVNRAWKKDSILRRIAWSWLGRRSIGYIWVLSFFFWISPRFQYPSLFDELRASELAISSI